MILLTDGTSKLELNLGSWDGDAYISVNVDSRGFCGASDLHISGKEFRLFCKNFIDLQKSFKGRAVLKSALPEELFVEVRPFDNVGHISIIGKIGYQVSTLYTMNWHCVEFGFEVEPQQLDRAIKVDWIQEYSE